MSDGQLAGACRLGFQGVGSAGAVRTRAGPETRRAPPWTLGAGSFSLYSESSLCYVHVCITICGIFWRERGEKLPFEFGQDWFIFPARRNASSNSHINRESNSSVCAVSPGQHREDKR